MKKYKYELQKGSRHLLCPICQKKTFKPYVEAGTDKIVDAEKFGRCERINNCGYISYPDTPDSDWKDYEQPKIPYKEKKPDFIPVDLVESTFCSFKDNVFFMWLVELFGSEKALKLQSDYNIGTAKNGGTIFWQQDKEGNFRTGKVMYYNQDGKRDKKKNSWYLHKQIKKDYLSFDAKLEIPDIRFIPISALNGDNVVDKSENMDWYKGPSLLWTLENVQVASDRDLIDGRFPVQWVIRPQSKEHPDFRGYAGLVSGGIFRKGEEVVVLPSGFTTRIKSIETMDGELQEAFPPMSVAMTLEDEIDISRGDMLAKINNQPTIGQDIELMVCWLNVTPLKLGGKYTVKHTTNEARAIIKEVKYKVNVNTLEKHEEDKEVGANDIARITIKTAKPLLYDAYRKNRNTGSLIIIDEFTQQTVGAGMII
jgi:hypothetical protein